MSDPRPFHSDSGPGTQLAKARRRSQMSVADVSHSLRLARSTIEDIEAERLDRISPAYLRGYITNYARLVGLEPRDLLAGLGPAEPEPLRHVAAVQRSGQRFDRFVRFATYALVTTVIVPPLVYFFVQGGARLFEAGSVADVDTSAPTVAERSDYRERVAEALAVQPLSPAGDPTSPLSASALPMPIAAERGGAAGEPLTPQEPAPSAAVEDPSAELVLELTGDSWVEIETGAGERLEFDLLRAGDRRSYRGEPPFKLLLGRGSAVGITLDGEPVAFEGHDVAGVAEFIVDARASGAPPADAAPSE